MSDHLKTINFFTLDEMLSLSVVIITHNRPEILKDCLASIRRQTIKPAEVIVVDNYSQDHISAILAADFPAARIIRTASNVGIPAGRNLGYRAASGDICVTLDDDAVFETDDALEKTVRYFEADQKLCCVSYIVKDRDGKIVRHYIPRRDRRIIAQDEPGAFFVGTGHAMHRERFLALGGFWEQLGLYFGEEPDLSYRILDAGYGILHSASITIRHDESKQARPSGRRIYHGTRNTFWIGLKNLPWPAVISLTALAWGYYFLEAVRTGLVRSYAQGIIDGLKGMGTVLCQRRCITPQTRALLVRYSGVYWH